MVKKLSLAGQSFLTLYISLILIILSVLVGTSVNKFNLQSAASDNNVVAQGFKEVGDYKAAVNPNFLQSEILLPNVFDSVEQRIQAEAFEPYRELLENHNLDLQIRIAGPAERISSQVVQVARILREQGFWKDSFMILGQQDPSAKETKVYARLLWSRP